MADAIGADIVVVSADGTSVRDQKYQDAIGSSISDIEKLDFVAGFIELVCGALLVIGLFSRPAAFLASGMCAVGYFIAHAPRGFYPIINGGELIALYCFVFLYIAAAGPGPWSVDAKMKK